MKYISVNKVSKIYEIRKISFFYMEVEAVQTDLTVDDVPENEVWDISEFKHYRVKLLNSRGNAEIIDFDDWKKEHDLKK